MSRLHIGLTLAALIVLPAISQAEAPAVSELRVQKVGKTVYFHVRFQAPDDLQLPPLGDRTRWDSAQTSLSRLPRLVPQDTKVQSAYLRLTFPGWEANRVWVWNPTLD